MKIKKKAQLPSQLGFLVWPNIGLLRILIEIVDELSRGLVPRVSVD